MGRKNTDPEKLITNITPNLHDFTTHTQMWSLSLQRDVVCICQDTTWGWV